MRYHFLGNTKLEVSEICLGTMTWGEQNDQAQAFEQLDYAVSQGVNFLDTAEMYPVPPKAETYSRTESIIGHWLAARKNRNAVIIATKIAGPSDQMRYIRGGTHHTGEHIRQAIDASLKRLQTDYIDLYQLHWPERPTNYFGQLGYTHQDTESIPLQETLEALQAEVKAGRIRHIGLSNETPWGLAHCLKLAELNGLPRVLSVQNPYSLLNRTYEIGLAEMSIREQAGLLAYSPLAFGVLSGKYLHGKRPEGARITMFSRFQRYNNAKAEQATARYVELAQQHGLDPAQMALAFIYRQPFVTSTIIGATTMPQLRDNIAAQDLSLSQEVLDGIEAIHRDIPNPCP